MEIRYVNDAWVITASQDLSKLREEIQEGVTGDDAIGKYIAVTATASGADQEIADLEAVSGARLDDADKLAIIFRRLDNLSADVTFQAHPAGACLPKGARPVGAVHDGVYTAYDAELIPDDVDALVAAAIPFTGDPYAEFR